MSPDNDPFDRLRRELRSAAEHQANASPATAPITTTPGLLGRVSRRSGLVAVMFTGSVATAAAAAVVIGTSGSPSAPVAGPLTSAAPTTTADRRSERLPARYEITVSPNLVVGTTGWCTSLKVRDATDRTYGGSGCSPAATTEQPFIAGAYTSVPRGQLGYAIVDDRITALRLRNGQRVLPRADPTLPNNWRIFVTLPGQNFSDAQYLRADGTATSTSPKPDRYIADQPATQVNGATPPTATCRIKAAPGTDIRRSRFLRNEAVAAPNVNGRAFLPCAASAIRTPAGTITATVLLDANNPGSRPAELPTPLKGEATQPKNPDVVPITAGFAKRDGNAWLVVQVGNRLRILAGANDTPSPQLAQALDTLHAETR